MGIGYSKKNSVPLRRIYPFKYIQVVPEFTSLPAMGQAFAEAINLVTLPSMPEVSDFY